jgi:hypothetical protein
VDDSGGRWWLGWETALGGLLVLLGIVILLGLDLGRIGWPVFVLVPGLGLLGVGLAAPGRSGELLAMVGGLVGFLVLAAFFEVVIGIGGRPVGSAGRYGLAVLLIVAGLVLLGRRLMAISVRTHDFAPDGGARPGKRRSYSLERPSTLNSGRPSMDRTPVPKRDTQCEPAARFLVVGACLLEGPPGRVHRGAIPPDHQLDRVVTGRLVVAASATGRPQRPASSPEVADGKVLRPAIRSHPR